MALSAPELLHPAAGRFLRLVSCRAMPIFFFCGRRILRRCIFNRSRPGNRMNQSTPSFQLFVGGVSRRRRRYPGRGLETAPTRHIGPRHHARHRARTPTATRPPPALTAPNWNPLQHPPTDQYQHNRGDPAPIAIEAGIPSSPASRETTPHGQEDLETIPDATHLTPRPAPTSTSNNCRL